MIDIFTDVLNDAKHRIEFMKNLSHTTFVTGENSGQAIVLVDNDLNEIEVNLYDIKIALTKYLENVVKECEDTIKKLEIKGDDLHDLHD